MKRQTQRAAAIIASWVLALSSTAIAAVQTARLENCKNEHLEEIFKFTQNNENLNATKYPSHPMPVLSETSGQTENLNVSVSESEENLSTLYTLPACSTYEGMKCYEDYKCITDNTSRQYELQTIACTDKDGFRKIDDRYLVAIGTYFEADCGTLFDIILENGEKIPAIVGDIKADIHTDVWNVYSGGICATEFIIDSDVMSGELLAIGDVSYYRDRWISKVKALYVYDENILEQIIG